MSGTPEVQSGAEDVVMDEFDDGAGNPQGGPGDGAEPHLATPAAPAGAAPTAAAAAAAAPVSGMPELPELTRKDKTLKEVLDLLEGDFAPIIPDTVTDYYLAKNGFSTADTKIKRILALAAQKFVLDIAQDAYEYSRIRSALSVYNSANPQVRAKQLLQNQQFANQQQMTGAGGPAGSADGLGEGGGSGGGGGGAASGGPGGSQGKIVLTMEDLNSALAEYGVNTLRPDFYR